jgi:hypothetical protein
MNSLINRGYIIRIDLTHEKPYGQRRIYLRNKN